MSKLQKVIEMIRGALSLAESELPDAAPAATGEPSSPHKRTIASTQLMNQVRNYVDQRNMAAYRVDPNTGGSYIDWDMYFSVMDLYYDDDGSLFLLGQQRGKLYRVPVTVTEDVVEFGEMLELSLSAERSFSRINVTRDAATGERRWFVIASSAVLNRVNEIDSTKLFDNFIRRAKETEQYPLLSFYHKRDTLQLGRANWLAREGYLYLAAGKFADTPDGQRCADTLERSDGEWGASIGYEALAEPEFVEVARGVQIPVFTDGVNREISIVLERDAADRFTRATAEEVKRTMQKNEYDALVKMFGEARAKELAEQVDATNRSIDEAELIRRGAPAPTASAVVAEPTAPAPTAPAPTAEAVVTETPAQEVPGTSERELELDEETLAALAEAVAGTPTVQQLQTSLLQVSEAIEKLLPQFETMQTEVRTVTTALEERLVELERTEADKQAEWLADLPPVSRTRVTFRPRDERPTMDPAALAAGNMASVANATLANLKTRKPG